MSEKRTNGKSSFPSHSKANDCEVEPQNKMEKDRLRLGLELVTSNYKQVYSQSEHDHDRPHSTRGSVRHKEHFSQRGRGNDRQQYSRRSKDGRFYDHQKDDYDGRRNFKNKGVRGFCRGGSGKRQDDREADRFYKAEEDNETRAIDDGFAHKHHGQSRQQYAQRSKDGRFYDNQKDDYDGRRILKNKVVRGYSRGGSGKRQDDRETDRFYKAGGRSAKCNKELDASRAVVSEEDNESQAIEDGYSKKNFGQSKKKQKMINVNVKNKDQKPMNLKTLHDLAHKNKSADEVLETATNPSSGFQQLLMDEDPQPEVLLLVLKVLGKACKNASNRNVIKLMIFVVTKKDNFVFLITRFLAKLENEEQIKALNFLLFYLLAFQKAMPANANEVVPLLLPYIKNYLFNLKSGQISFDTGIFRTVEELEELNNHFESDCLDQHLSKAQRVFEEKKHAMDPIESFRSLSIFPTKDDLCRNEIPFLRPNLDYGSYRDVEHYLDVQFRLLREDFIRPLREGIGKYKVSNIKNWTTISELHIFRDVHILYPKCDPYGIMHNVKFNVTRFQNVDWEARKRWLMPGSLLCLSNDNFNTMLFAEVSTRDSLLLRQGIFDIRFDKITDNIMAYRPSDTFVMLETNAYFEAYRHNLRKLQSLNEDTMPMQDYIISASKEFRSPSYLTTPPDLAYDLRPLMIPIPDKIVSVNNMMRRNDETDDYENGERYEESEDSDDREFEEEEGGYYVYQFPDEMAHGNDVAILDHSSWPSRDELCMDDHQYQAIKNALTKEFVIIQGPPGTGKTFIGLRIMQVLIANRHVWRRPNPIPILIVCYTNHALDQFLKDILLFTNKLVRVGGRCDSAELENYKLSFLRKERREKGQIRKGAWRELRLAVKRLEQIKYDVNQLQTKIIMANQDVIPENELQLHMEHNLWHSLKNDGPHCAQRVDDSTGNDDGKMILDWLALRLRGAHAPQWLHEQEEFSEIVKSEKEMQKDVDEQSKDNSNKKKDTDKVFAADDEDDFFLSRHVDEDDKNMLELLEKMYADEDGKDRNTSDDEDTGWELLGGSETRRTYIETMLKNEKMLTDDEIMKLNPNIWSLPITIRWCLYRTWVARYALGTLDEIIVLLKQYQEEVLNVQKLRHEEDLNILRNACVVGMTTTGAAKYQDMIHDLKPKIVIVEEAAEVIEAHIVTSLCKETEHLILIGDHQQLRPNPAVYELALKYKLDISLFERMVKNKVPCETLVTQHRMRPSICNLLVPHIYKELKCHASVKLYGRVKGIEKSVYFISHDFLEGTEPESTSLVNNHEAEFLVALCRYLILQGYNPDKITILSTYSMQANLLRKLVDSDAFMRKKVHVTPVDSYQGNENRIVLISFVRSNDDGKIGFLSIPNRVCVALSRAKQGLYCIGNFQLLAQKNDLWKNIVNYLDKNNLIGSDLKLFCQNHVDDFVYVSSANDFRKVPEGGCIRQCTHVYGKCKHRCLRRCHPRDPNHEELLCKERCNRKLKGCSHRCQNVCGECLLDGGCDQCLEKVVKELNCCHKAKVHCGAKVEEYSCPMPCSRVLPCSHKCTKKCGEPCILICNENIAIPAPCCHFVQVKCHMQTNKKKLLDECKEICGKVLICGHVCKGTCGSCFQGKFHKMCKQPCERKLVCGHSCPDRCSNICPPCRLPCNNRCDHDECRLPCSYPCKQCEKPCVIDCSHRKCNRLCREVCNFEPCIAPCPKLLKCRHPCMGFCGDPCPRKVCRECCPPQFKNVDRASRFVQLEQCNHAIEEKVLVAILMPPSEGNVFQLPSCPECNVPIRSNRRFSKLTKSYNSQLQEIKDQLFSICQDKKKQLQEVLSIGQQMINNTEHCVQIHVEKANRLLSFKKQGVNMITMLKNILILLEIVNTCSVEFDNIAKFMLGTKVGSRSLSDIAKCIRKDILHFIGEMLKEKHCSLQQLLDVSQEVLRLQLLCALAKELEVRDGWEDLNTKLGIRIRDSLQILSRLLPLMNSSVQEPIIPAIIELQESRGLNGDKLSDQVFGRIVYPVDMSISHWYRCPQGHAYGDSLQPVTAERKCPKCPDL